MKLVTRTIFSLLLIVMTSATLFAQGDYVPTKANLKARAEFEHNRFGIFIHWGFYSMFGNGEWIMRRPTPIDRDEYAKAADAFYPHRFDARQWVSAIKDSGAKYICITSRHHDGFSMWDTDQSDYNIVDATPFKRDVIKELAEECHRQGIKLHFYYSHMDWYRYDYPVGRQSSKIKIKRPAGVEPNYESYYKFMNAQLTELLTRYGKIGAIWFDGWWDHRDDVPAFDWKLEAQYKLIHDLQPSCLIANNHHVVPFAGEDFQIFERDLPGENKAGHSKSKYVSKLPLETCETMNTAWGYKATDEKYKSVETLVRYLVSTAGKGANLLLNIGPQPNGELPAESLERLKGMGEWTRKYGQTVYGTKAGDIAAQPWGVTTRKGDKLYVHIFDCKEKSLFLPLNCKVVKAVTFDGRKKVEVSSDENGVTLNFSEQPSGIDYIVELTTK